MPKQRFSQFEKPSAEFHHHHQIDKLLASKGYDRKRIVLDKSSLFNAVADQIGKEASEVRQSFSAFMKQQHPAEFFNGPKKKMLSYVASLCKGKSYATLLELKALAKMLK